MEKQSRGHEINLLKYKEHTEANEYGGCEYQLKGKKYIERTSKNTPKKIGQFVTLWKRNRQGVTIPFDMKDDFDFVMILCFKDKNEGRFLFPKNILHQKGVLSDKMNKKSGKRGFRVYPRWDLPQGQQALFTQNWQLKYFIEL